MVACADILTAAFNMAPEGEGNYSLVILYVEVINYYISMVQEPPFSFQTIRTASHIDRPATCVSEEFLQNVRKRERKARRNVRNL